jgi:hypothetical protein
MPEQCCPTCGQKLPAGQTTSQLQARIDADVKRQVQARHSQIEADTESKFKVKWMTEVLEKVAADNKEIERQQKNKTVSRRRRLPNLKGC